MKCILLLLFLFYLHGARADLEVKLLDSFASVRENGSISDRCQEVLQLYADNILNFTNKWAFSMLDATSKIPVGLLSLNLGELGQFSQCIRTESNDGLIKGKYCLGTLVLSLNSLVTIDGQDEVFALHSQATHVKKVSRRIVNLDDDDGTNDDNSFQPQGISWAICLPSDCTDEDVGEILSRLIGSKSAICQTEEDLSPPLTDGAIGAISVLAFFAFLLVTSTAIDLYYNFTHTTPPHVSLLAFSMYSNGKKLFQISSNSSELTCLNGIRFWSMMWVIAGHVFSLYSSLPVTNYINIVEWLDTLRSMVIVNGTLSVDTFFLLSGLLLVYSFIKAKHNGVNFNIFQFYLHRYLRLTPALAAAILVSAHLLKYTGTGPHWNSILSFERSCQKHWWTTLLYVQNYFNGESNMCLPQSWYLSVDMQLYVITPLVLIPLWRYPKIGVGIVVASIGTFIIVPFCIAYINKLPGLMTNGNDPAGPLRYMKLYYTKTHARAAPFFIGVLLGYILARIKIQNKARHLTFNKIVVIVIWATCIAVGLTCIYGGQSTLNGPDYDVWANSFYIALVKPVWALCLTWVIFACVSGYGGPINWILSLPIYQVLNRFTYSMYIIHFPLMYVIGFASKSGIYFDEFSVSLWFWGLTMLTFALSVPWVLAFESPVVILEKLLFGGAKKKTKQEENGHKPSLPT